MASYCRILSLLSNTSDSFEVIGAVHIIFLDDFEELVLVC